MEPNNQQQNNQPINQPNNQPHTQSKDQPKSVATHETNSVNKRNMYITIAIIVIIIVLALIMPKHKAVAPTVTTPSVTDTTTGDTTTGASTPAKKGTSAAPAATLSYKDALAKYQNSIVRITDECSAKPVTETFVMAKGQVIMIANDSMTKAHTVVINGTTYSLGLQHYKTFTLPVAGTISSACDPKTGTTTVSLAPQQ